MKKWPLFLGLMLVVMLAAISCNKEGNEPAPIAQLDRKPMLENYANNFIAPAYAKMTTDVEALESAVSAFVAAPDEAKLIAAQQALATAYLQWQKTDLYEFGPAEGAQLRSYMNTYPVTVSKVTDNISSGTYDLESFGNRDAQGFPAMDYLLNGTDMSMYTTGANAAGRKAYLSAVVAKMAEKIKAVNTDWSTYKSTFIESTGTDVNSSLSQVVNGCVLYYERYLRGGKIGIPAGVMSGTPSVGHVESFYSPENSIPFAVAALNEVKNFYTGGTAASMQTYLAAIGTKDDNGMLMADLIQQEMTEAINSMKGLNGTLIDNINNNRTSVLQAYDEIQDVVPLLKVDMVSAFSISITYTDNDGD
ncbi:MAG: imelysin family protein [Chitinophagaceae bacterium]|nr:imelysin family protein [Chitinophagaceae bacterium]